MAKEEDYVRRAVQAIRDVLDEQHAVTGAELDARISERYHEGSRENIDPHHVTTALNRLTRSGVVVRDTAAARGGHEVETIQPADQHRRGTRIAHAARRKRLLAARYAGWAQGTKRHPHGLIGPAGEAAVRAALVEVETFMPVMQGAGEVASLLGVKLPGPADSGGLVVPVVDGIPGRPVTVLVEVKNVRSWIYPSAAELYQLLHKGCLLQQAQPDQPLVPVLVCRRAHPKTFTMARQLGFFVIATSRQYVVGDDLEETDVVEVRTELHFQDLVLGVEASQRVIDRVRKTLPVQAAKFAEAWRSTALAAGYGGLFDALRKNELKPWDRRRLTNELRALVDRDGLGGGW